MTYVVPQQSPVALVFGGRSPIAVACAKHLSKTQDVILVTRRIDEEFTNLFCKSSNVTLCEADLELTGSASKVAQKVYDEGKAINALVFLQRYRPNGLPDFMAHCAVELFCIDEVLQTVASQKDPLSYLNIAISSSPAAHRVVVDQDLSYHIVKSGQEALVRYAAIKYGSNRIRINAIRIGSIVFKERASKYWDSLPNVVSGLQGLSAVGDISTSDSIGECFANLVNSSLNSLSGQVVSIDNGFSLMDSSQVAKQILEHNS